MIHTDERRSPWPIVGHEWAVGMLSESIARSHVTHAYLFTGPARIGKRTVAQVLAQSLNCSGANPPCGQCVSCRKLAHGNHPDVHVVEGLGAAIKIDQIRGLQRDVALSAYESPWKVYVLSHFERATTEAANCLLKTLEEPPGRVVLLLTAPSPHLLLPTIVSRCQQVALRPPAVDRVQQALIERWQASPEQAELLARLSAGRIGWAVEALTDKTLLVRRTAALDDLFRLMGANRAARLQYAEKVSGNREAISAVLDVWQAGWRDLLLINAGLAERIVNVDRKSELSDRARSYRAEQLHAFLSALLTTSRRLEQDVNARLALEALMLSIPAPRAACAPNSAIRPVEL